MCKTVVYRVENEGGYGPYGHDEENSFALQLAIKHNDMMSHPSIRYDFPVEVQLDLKPWKHVCGCTSLTALAEWFSGFGEELRDRGFRVVAYEIVNYYVGNSGKQVVFAKPPGARPLATWLCDYVI